MSIHGARPIVATALAASLFAPVVGHATSQTKDDPIRFSAFAVRLEGGQAGNVDVVIERWSTEAERSALAALVMKTTRRPDSQEPLVEALQDIEPRVGFIRTPNRLGWDIKYGHQRQLPDGTRQIVVVTDKPVSFFAARNQTRTMDYPFTLVEMRFKEGSSTGEGKLLGQTSLAVKDGQLEIEIYGQEPVRLTTISEKKPK
jgi:hypothetical protein